MRSNGRTLLDARWKPQPAMGIRGLTGFIDHNHHLLQECELRDCNVIVDGNNFYHFLYHARNVRSNFGGDYDVYRKRIISTFESLQLCGITPYIVLDGAYTKDGRKLKTSLSRASARIRLVDAMVNVSRGQALPCLAYETFLQVLRELRIPHVVCQFEADNEIAILANQMNCPVISNDSDFYIFDLKSGFLPLDYIDFNPLHRPATNGSDAATFLFCRRYNVDDFIGSFDGLNRSALPLFASMLGNDYINSGAFAAFYSQFKVSKVVSKKYHLPPRLSKVISVLHWLHSCGDDESLEEKLFNFVKANRKDKVVKLFHSSISSYQDIENFSAFDLHEVFTKGHQDYALTACKDFCCYDGRRFPPWFLEAAASGKLSPLIVNAAILHRVILLCQVEDLKVVSSFNCSVRLRQVLYGILMKESCSVSDCQDPKLSCQSEENSAKCVSSVSPTNDVSQHKRNSIIGNDVESSTATDNQSEAQSDNACDVKRRLNDEDDKKEKCGDLNFQSLKASQADSKIHFIEEYNRLNKGLKKCQIYPMFEIDNVPVPSLCELESMTEAERRRVFFESLGVSESFAGQFDESLRLYLSCVVMWLRTAEPKVSRLHLDCVLVCLVVLETLYCVEEVRKKKGKEKQKGAAGGMGSGDTASTIFSQDASDAQCVTSSKEIDAEVIPHGTDLLKGTDEMVMTTGMGHAEKTLSGTADAQDITSKSEPSQSSSHRVTLSTIDPKCSVSLEELDKIQKSTEKYHKQAPTFNHRKHFEPSVVHIFSQLQACTLDASNLNKLLRSPVHEVRPAQVLNGTFLYNLFIEIERRSHPDLFLSGLLGGTGRGLHVVFTSLKDRLLQAVDPSWFLSQSSGPTPSVQKKNKKRKTGKEQKCEETVSKQPDKEENDEELVEDVVTYGFDVANKFSMLSMEM